MKDRQRALKTYKAFLNRGMDCVFSEANFTVFELFGYQIHIEKVIENRETVEDMELLDIDFIKSKKVILKRKSNDDCDGGIGK